MHKWLLCSGPAHDAGPVQPTGCSSTRTNGALLVPTYLSIHQLGPWHKVNVGCRALQLCLQGESSADSSDQCYCTMIETLLCSAPYSTACVPLSP